MVNANVDNTPVSETLADTESVTVPSGEVWDVTITTEPTSASGGSSNSTLVDLNGVTVAGSTASSTSAGGDNSANASANSTVPFDTVLTGSDTITANGGGVVIGGYKVQE